MKSFLTRAICAIAIVAVLFCYNSVVIKRKSLEKASYEKGVAQGLEGSENTTGGYRDGQYTGSAQGYGGTITVCVSIEDGIIRSVTLESASGEDGAYLSSAMSVVDSIIEAQSPKVDSISGATFTSTGIKNATRDALRKAIK